MGRDCQQSGSSARLIIKAAGALLLSATLPVAASTASRDDALADQQTAYELTVLHINDHHSHLEPKARSLRLTNAHGEKVAVAVSVGGFPRVTSAFSELAEGRDNVLKLHAGDALTGTLYYNHAGELGEADAAMMNTVCFDAFTLGNHEFDKGDTELKRWLERLRSTDCQTPVLSANVQFGGRSALHPSHAPGLVQPYTVVQRSGEHIGIVGLTIAQKTKVSSRPDTGTQFENEAVAAQAAIDALREQAVDKIILLSHIGYQNDKRLLAQLSGVDVVVGGDSHSLLGPDTLRSYGAGVPVGPYAETLLNRDGEKVCLAHAAAYSLVVGELNVGFDAAGRVTHCGGTPHILIGDHFTIGGQTPNAAGGQTPSDADLAAIQADIADSGFLRITAEDAGAVRVLQPYKESVEAFHRTIVGVAPLALCSRRVPGGLGTIDYGRSSPACNAEARVSERGGDIQQLVAQAYLEVADALYGGADISLQSGGGVRVPLEGEITAANILEVLPFDGSLWSLTITGREAKAMVEEGLEAVFGPHGSTGPYPYTGGMRWDVNVSQPKGKRAGNFEVFDRATNSWLPLEDSREYRLVALSFNASGGDGYTTLAQVDEGRRLDVGVADVDVFLSYIEGLPKDANGLPMLHRLDPSFYSTKSFAQ